MCHGFRSTIYSSVLSVCSICSKNCRMDTEVLDLIADDESGVQKQKSTYHWDKVHKLLSAEACSYFLLTCPIFGQCSVITLETLQQVLDASLTPHFRTLDSVSSN